MKPWQYVATAAIAWLIWRRARASTPKSAPGIVPGYGSTGNPLVDAFI